MKKNYIQPIVEAVRMQASTVVLAGSPDNTLHNSGSGTDILSGDPIIGG